MDATSINERRVLVVAPTGSDAIHTVAMLEKSGFKAERLPSVTDASSQIELGCGMLLLTEEALNGPQRTVLAMTLDRQPRWSSIPTVVITSGGKEKILTRALPVLGLNTHITLLERPLRVATLMATVEVALATRDQQYEVRDLLAEREKLLSSLEEKVQERTAKLQAMVEEMEAFSYSVSHDLRAPLRVLDGYAQALQEDYEPQLPPEAQRLLGKISAASQRMDRLTQDLLAYTRIAKASVLLEPTDLDSVLEDVIESYPSLHEVRAHIHIKKPLGYVMGHGPSLIQCFSNLLENAVKFTPAGSVLEIRVSSKNVADNVRVSIVDKGIGIDSTQLTRIFGLFERAGGGSFSGTGIGLAIVKKAVERMNGKVGVSSKKGQGSTFWIEIGKAPL